MVNVYEQQDSNKRRSILVVVFFVLFVTLIAWVFSQVLGYGPGLMGMALILAGIFSFSSYWWGDKIILTISGARPASKKEDFNFFTVAENLALASQIPPPKLYVINDSAPNAFATGRDPKNAVICVTKGLLAKLDRTELEGVIAHELSHVRNYDTRLMSLVTILVGMVTLLADWFLRGARFSDENRERGNLGAILLVVGIVSALLSPLVAQLIQLAISRRREFLADSSAVLLTKYPEGLARALEKISADKEPLEAANKATAHLYIVNPLKGQKFVGVFANLFNTHPAAAERIKILRQMA